MKRSANLSLAHSIVIERGFAPVWSDRVRAQVGELATTWLPAIPNTAWLTMIFLAALLLSGGVLLRAGGVRRDAQAAYTHTQSRLVQAQTQNAEIKQQTSHLRTNAQAAAQAAQQQLHYVKANEIVVGIK